MFTETYVHLKLAHKSCSDIICCADLTSISTNDSVDGLWTHLHLFQWTHLCDGNTKPSSLYNIISWNRFLLLKNFCCLPIVKSNHTLPTWFSMFKSSKFKSIIWCEIMSMFNNLFLWKKSKTHLCYNCDICLLTNFCFCAGTGS